LDFGNYTITLTGIAPNTFSANAGDITIKATSLAIADNAQIAATTTGSGQAGNILVDTNTFNVSTGGQLLTATSGSGKAGEIQLTATRQATLTDAGTGLFANTTNGVGGNIAVTTGQFEIANGATLNATTTASNSSGSISVNASTFNATGSSRLLTSTSGAGKAGDIKLNVSDRVSLNNPGTGLFAGTSGGQGGAITIGTNDFQISNGAVLDTTTTGSSAGGNITLTAGMATGMGGAQLRTTTSSSGTAGNITLTVGDLVSLAGAGTALLANTAANSTGDGGDITVTANALDATGGAQLVTSTAGRGTAGNVTVNLGNRLLLSDPGTGLFASTAPGSSGAGGNITTAAQSVIVQKGAQIAVDSQGTGIGGSISLRSNRLQLLDRGSITAETTSAQGGNITLDVRDLILLRRNSLISATAGTAQGAGAGGNITIRAGFVLAVLQENSDIVANAFTGRGGNITITTNAIFGLLPQPRLTPFSDITASSQFGLQGTIAINTLNVDPNRGLVELNPTLSDPSRQIGLGCAVGGRLANRDSRFVVAGRGGVTASPTDTFTADQALVELLAGDENGRRVRDEGGEDGGEIRGSTPSVEAQGWVQAGDGSIEFVANSAFITFHDAPFAVVPCDGSSKP